MTQEYEVEDLFNISFVPEDTPLYLILTGGSNDIKAEGVIDYSIETLSIIRTYLETGVIDIINLFEEDSDVDIDELVDGFCYLLSLHKPDNFPAQYWFATLTENWILEQWEKGNTPKDNKWLIDVTDLAYKLYGHTLSVIRNSNYVIAGRYILSLIDQNVEMLDSADIIDIFYIGEIEKLDACDDLSIAVRYRSTDGKVSTIKDVISWERINRTSNYQQYTDGKIIYYDVRSCVSLPTWKLIINKWPSASHILTSLYVDCYKVCLIGDKIYASPCGYYAIKNKTIKLTSDIVSCDSLIALKYVRKRGYSVCGIETHNKLGENVKYEDRTSLSFQEMYNVIMARIPINRLYMRVQQNEELGMKRAGLISFTFQNETNKMKINFSPLLKTVDDIKQQLSQLDETLLSLALDLIDSFKWVFSPANVKQPVDFIWYESKDSYNIT